MSNRDWEKELAEIDKRLASVPDAPAERPTPRAPASVGRAAAPAPAPAAAPQRRIGTPAEAPGRRSWRTQLALLLRIAFGAAVVAALIYWPYPSRCGVGLGYYLALVAVLALAGIATSVAAWRHRSGFVHVLGIVMLGAAGVLGAREVLPKVGYAYPTATHPVAWACE
jgi:hypothetical protein